MMTWTGLWPSEVVGVFGGGDDIETLDSALFLQTRRHLVGSSGTFEVSRFRTPNLPENKVLHEATLTTHSPRNPTVPPPPPPPPAISLQKVITTRRGKCKTQRADTKEQDELGGGGGDLLTRLHLPNFKVEKEAPTPTSLLQPFTPAKCDQRLQVGERQMSVWKGEARGSGGD